MKLIGRKKQLRAWEKPIPKNQKRHLTQCPKCKQKFYYWQYAAKHSEENKHYGDYNVH